MSIADFRDVAKTRIFMHAPLSSPGVNFQKSPFSKNKNQTVNVDVVKQTMTWILCVGVGKEPFTLFFKRHKRQHCLLFVQNRYVVSSCGSIFKKCSTELY